MQLELASDTRNKHKIRVINKQEINVDTDDESVGSTTSVLSVR